MFHLGTTAPTTGGGGGSGAQMALGGAERGSAWRCGAVRRLEGLRSVVFGAPRIGDHPHGPAPAEPHLPRHRQAGVGGPVAPPADAPERKEYLRWPAIDPSPRAAA